MAGNRNAGVDAVRILGIVAIVAGHVWMTPVMRELVFPWHVPVFFFLSGYLWKSGRGLREEISRRTSTLLKPYAFWLIALYVPWSIALFIFDEATPAKLWEPLYGGRGVGGPFNTFWFVFALFATAVIWRMLSTTPIAVRVGCTVVGALLGTLFGPQLASTPLALGNALPALVFLAAGQLARHLPIERTGARILTSVTALVVSGALVASGLSLPVNIKSGDWGTPVLSYLVAILISWALVILAETWARNLIPRVSAAISYAALTGFTVVLVHSTVIWLGFEAGVPLPLLFALALLIPVGVALIALRTRFSQWLTGVPRVTPRTAEQR
ncbi:acyltransferase family protein [Leucobacter tenebrionis]|uniref:acyltransferase family protein n=1 Tax=Leucobacter tenebrionis TaxID=2873270 RepID=UPI001CA714F0|nr:acyltransferase family protein [Leucobacter tenebrionis]QZY53062.1 acyltransferase family protein [Leucobacter tenebrionis]